jgi:hypothetical protein
MRVYRQGCEAAQLLISGDAQYVASTGSRVVASHAAGIKEIPRMMRRSYGLGDDPSIFPALEQGTVDAALLSTPARLLAEKARRS